MLENKRLIIVVTTLAGLFLLLVLANNSSLLNTLNSRNISSYKPKGVNKSTVKKITSAKSRKKELNTLYIRVEESVFNYFEKGTNNFKEYERRTKKIQRNSDWQNKYLSLWLKVYETNYPKLSLKNKCDLLAKLHTSWSIYDYYEDMKKNDDTKSAKKIIKRKLSFIMDKCKNNHPHYANLIGSLAMKANHLNNVQRIKLAKEFIALREQLIGDLERELESVDPNKKESIESKIKKLKKQKEDFASLLDELNK